MGRVAWCSVGTPGCAHQSAPPQAPAGGLSSRCGGSIAALE
eukprot:CAMPEP_0206143638 /NCGR_PEP_ID=MMETSP1473-20131121/21284_1 /ASSEMBLY_ACC=CAM_ASM_001109 /TAXON_ID=1461547 /ORGANISM="Stichococcus sp, Strain RCC1054" /LENGTH=40 /DNA_ID= /DNA_START= /DNA_END= /DNA_ORIENTATION=